MLIVWGLTHQPASYLDTVRFAVEEAHRAEAERGGAAAALEQNLVCGGMSVVKHLAGAVQ